MGNTSFFRTSVSNLGQILSQILNTREKAPKIVLCNFALYEIYSYLRIAAFFYLVFTDSYITGAWISKHRGLMIYFNLFLICVMNCSMIKYYTQLNKICAVLQFA